MDEDVFAFALSHAENDFPGLDLEIINPGVGLLNPSRKVWAWFSYDDGDTLHPLFFGRLVGVPQDLKDEIIKISFIARPTNYIQAKRDLAAQLRVFPFWDPLFMTPDAEENPDTVFESRPPPPEPSSPRVRSMAPVVISSAC